MVILGMAILWALRELLGLRHRHQHQSDKQMTASEWASTSGSFSPAATQQQLAEVRELAARAQQNIERHEKECADRWASTSATTAKVLTEIRHLNEKLDGPRPP